LLHITDFKSPHAAKQEGKEKPMNFLETERETLQVFLPFLDAQLREIPLNELEKPDNPGLAMFREANGPALLVPREFGGLGATPLDAVRIQRALAARSPSLAIAATMHNFSLATLVEYGEYSGEFLKTIAAGRLLLASGFAEGRTGASILAPSMQACRVEGGYLVSGSKKPCSLSRSMHLLTASIAVPNGDGNSHRAVAIIPADADGIERKPFWKNWVLAGAESDEVVLQDVFVPEPYIFFPQVEDGLDPVETAGFLWFELLVCGSYLGAASGVAERALAAGKGGPFERSALVSELEGAMAALEGVACAMLRSERCQKTLARSLFVRYAVQEAIERAAALGAELLGGMAFIASSDLSYLLAACRALAFHPPSRTSTAPALSRYLAGECFRMV
jgi:alkylation response protein AidB-like acyl-CoA dehydrogenase